MFLARLAILAAQASKIACRRAAAWTTSQLAAEIRAMASSRRHILGVTELETLTDILVHTQDIALPLGRRQNMPPEAAAASASRVLAMRWPPPQPSVRKLAGFGSWRRMWPGRPARARR